MSIKRQWYNLGIYFGSFWKETDNIKTLFILFLLQESRLSNPSITKVIKRRCNRKT